ncbi:MAG: radical SAM-associated putative lipoprotein [Tannerella sp.]|jgi:putative lipoprotein (rSAM/lipoprotein system)|nr:radical SAM-associated putative lipoprotein [Tannerella sp.]
MKINRKLIKGTNWALGALLSALGFSSCLPDGIDRTPMEYGVPYAKYKIMGKVIDEEGKGLDGIRITIPNVELIEKGSSTYIPSNPYVKYPLNDTLYTQNDGRFEYEHDGANVDSLKYNFKFEDISENPKTEIDSTTVSFSHSDLKNGNGKWYFGQATKEITMELKSRK